MKPSRLVSSPLARLLAVLTAVLAAAPLAAQPSGGPYGPVQQHYAPPEARRTIFVAPEADPAAAGANLDYPTTLESAIARVETGDAIVLRGGLYRTGSLVLSQGVTLQPHADERPVLTGTQLATDWTALPDGRWRTTWTRLFPAEPADWWRRERNVARTPLHLFNNDLVFLDDERLAAVGRREDVGAGTYYIDYENAHVYLGDDPAGRRVEITAHDSALVRTFRSAHGKSNDGRGPVIRGLTFTRYARLALEVEGVEPGRPMDPSEFGKEVVGTVLEHLTLTHCGRVAGYFRGDGLVIRHCLVSDCGTEGLYVINSADVLLERNIVTRTNSAENLTGYYASAVKIFNQSHRVVCRDNLIIDNPNASGIWYDVGNVDSVVVNNWFERTPNAFFYEISRDAICAGNVFVDCTPGVRVLNSAGVALYQNTLYNSQATFERSARSSAAGDHFGWHASAGPDVDARDGHAFVNNLLVADEHFADPLLRFWQHEAVDGRLTQPQADTLDGNVYARRLTGDARPWIAWSPVPNAGGHVDLFSLSALRERLPNAASRSHAYVDYRGPLFRSAELGHFELQSGFPGADAGVPLPAAVADLLGRSPDAPPSPGAYPSAH